MFPQVYPRMIDLRMPIQRHIESSFENYEQPGMIDNPGKADESNDPVLSQKTSGPISPGAGHQRQCQAEAPKAKVTAKSNANASLVNSKEDYHTAEELSDDDAQKSDDDSWWYSDAKAPESKYDEWYYLVYLPSMQASGPPKPSSRRRYRGMFNSSQETPFEPVKEGAIANKCTEKSGDQSSQAKDSDSKFWKDQQIMAAVTAESIESDKSTVDVDAFAQQPANNNIADFVDWDNFESHGSASVCSSSPEMSPRSIPLEWDDFDVPELPEPIPNARREEDLHLAWEEPPQECQEVHEDTQEGEVERDFTSSASLRLPFLSDLYMAPQNENYFTRERPNEKINTFNPFITTPEPELNPPQRYSAPLPFSNQSVSPSPNLIEASPESFNPFRFPAPVSSDSGPPRQQSSNESVELGLEPKTKIWTEVLKSEMAELSRSCSESQYFDMPWVHSKLPPLSFSSDSQDEDTEAEIEPSQDQHQDRTVRRFTLTAAPTPGKQCRSSTGI